VSQGFNLGNPECDGRYVVFSTVADMGYGSNGMRQVYRAERTAAGYPMVVVHVSVQAVVPPGAPPGLALADCDRPSISESGNCVSFETKAQLISSDTDTFSDIYAWVSGEPPLIRRLSIRRDGQGNPIASPNGDSMFGSLSGSGVWVAFTSKASNLVAADANGARSDVFLVNTNGTSTPQLVSVNAGGAQSLLAGFSTIEPIAGQADLSKSVGRVVDYDGLRVVFCGKPCDWTGSLCPAENPADCSNGQCTSTMKDQVYLRELSPLTPGTYMVSAQIQPGNGNSRRPSISADGERIAYASDATSFAGSSGDSFFDVFYVKKGDVVNGTPNPKRVSTPYPSTEIIDGHSLDPVISSDGLADTFYICFALVPISVVPRPAIK